MQDNGDGDEDEEEEEEEEEEDGGRRGNAYGRTRGHGLSYQSPTMSPPSSAPPRTPRDTTSPVNVSSVAQKLQPATNPRVKVVRQWAPNARVASH